MSVLSSDRHDSVVEFVNNARELCEHTLRYTNKKFANSQKDIVTRIRNLALSIYENVIAGNSIYAKTENDKQLRRQYFVQARAECYSLSALLSAVKKILQTNVSDYGWLMFGKYLSNEMKLLTALI